MLGAICSGLGYLENRPVWDTAIRDTLGNTVPKTALTRTPAERNDVAISQIGNTVAFVGGGLSVDFFLRKTFQKFQKEGAKELTAASRWAVLSRSLGIYSAMASSMWAMPFIRNYITTKRTGMVNYADVIKAGGLSKGPQTPEQKVAVEASLKESKKKALTILGAGAAGIIFPAAFGRIAAERGWAAKGLETLFNKPVLGLKDSFHNKFLLKDGKFDKLGGIPSMMFWGIPAYIGWYHASRDPYEKKEVFVRCANFVACFSLPPVLAKKAFAGKFAKDFKQLGEKVNFNAIKLAQDAGKLGEKEALRAKKLLISQNLLGMGSSIVLLGVTPQLLNIYLTKRRLAKEAAALKTAKAPAQSVTPLPAEKKIAPDATASSTPLNQFAFNPGWANPAVRSAFSPTFAQPTPPVAWAQPYSVNAAPWQA